MQLWRTSASCLFDLWARKSYGVAGDFGQTGLLASPVLRTLKAVDARLSGHRSIAWTQPLPTLGRIGESAPAANGAVN